MMQCRVCGRAVAEGDRFCTACGTSLADEPAVPASGIPSGRDATGAPGAVTTKRTSVERDPESPSRPEAVRTQAPAAVASSAAGISTTAPVTDRDAATRTSTPVTEQSVAERSVTEQSVTEQSDTSSGSSTADPIGPGAAAPTPAPDAPGIGQLAPTERITAPVEPVASDDATGGWGDDDPVWAATGPVEAVPAPAATPVIVPAYPDDDGPEPSAEPPIEPLVTAAPTTVITTPTPAATVEVSVLPTALPEERGFRFSAVTLLAVVGAIVTLFAMFATVVTVSSDDRIVGNENTPVNFRIGGWIPSDLADNLPIAGLIAVALLVCGGVAAGFGWRGGSGLAAGSGLAIAGLAALTIGLAQIPIDAAYEMAEIPTDERFTLTITRDLGYWLQLAAGAIGIIVFFASLNDAVGDGRRGLNPWIAALGALAGIVMAAGPLIPEGLAVFSDNWYVTEGPGQPPAMLLSMRLVQLSLLALTSLIGFLSVRRWGLGVAVGGALPSLWLLISTLFELTDHPVGPGFRNPGATDMTVHGVTMIGASSLAAFLILALVAAYDQAQHEW